MEYYYVPFARQNSLKLTVKLDNLRLRILRLYLEMLEENVLQRTGFIARKADREVDNTVFREMGDENLTILYLTLLCTFCLLYTL